MSRKDIKDPSGKVVMQVVEYDGFLFPVSVMGGIVEQLKQLKDMPFKNSDVCVVSYPKSGTHWCYEVVDMLRNKSSEYHDKMPPLIEMFPVEKLKQVTDGVYVSHLVPRHMPKNFMDKKCKIINIYRNPKDVCVSMFNFIKKTKGGELMKDMEFDVFFDMYMTGQLTGGSWAGYVKEWTNFEEKNPSYPLLNLCYEDMKKDLKTHVKKIADFLELDTSDELISEIANKCEFKAMSAYKNSNIPAAMSRVTDVKDKHIMYRKGEAGDWKNWLKVAQSEAMDAAIESAKIPLEIKYT
ncbi:sulfotransferase 1B1-like [Ostrea edulis]|uniref:sulfotransferase 1B1-like n=1 Tax=Ostrea edulis TaxID=37623 RepID=UPI0024AFD618|nr:sulfotransferase 1B1-like [Ostrea edulis]